MFRKSLPARITTLEQLASSLPMQGFKTKKGLSQIKLQEIEAAIGAHLPREMRIMLEMIVPISHNNFPKKRFVDWTKDPTQIMAESKQRLREVLRFDIERNNYWYTPIFGEKPEDIDAATLQAGAALDKMSPLIPLWEHRMIPTSYHGVEAPVLSVWQFVDSIIYADTLMNALIDDFGLIGDKQYDVHADMKDVDDWGKLFLRD